MIEEIYTTVSCFNEHGFTVQPKWKVCKETDEIMESIGCIDAVWSKGIAKLLYQSAMVNAPASMVYLGFDCELDFKSVSVTFIMREDATKVEATRCSHGKFETVVFIRNPIWGEWVC